MMLQDILDNDKIKYCYFAVLKSSNTIIAWTFDKKIIEIYEAQRNPRIIKIIKMDKEDALDKIYKNSPDRATILHKEEIKDSRLNLMDVTEGNSVIKLAVTEQEYTYINMLEETLLDMIPQLTNAVAELFLDQDKLESDLESEIVSKLPSLLNNFFKPNSTSINRYKIFLIICNDTLFDEEVFDKEALSKLDKFLDY